MYEDGLAMQAVMSGMFDAKIKAVKEQIEILSKHEYAIRTSEEVDAMKAETKATRDQVRATREASQRNLVNAEAKAKEIIETAHREAEDAVNQRAAIMAETQRKVEIIIADAEKKGKEITAYATGDLSRIKNETTAAQATLDEFLNKIRDANQELTRINKAIEAEKSRVAKIFA
jgi:hypothetical protein